MRNPKYHIYLTPDERRTVINSLIDLRNDFISQGKYIDIIDELFKSQSQENQGQGGLNYGYKDYIHTAGRLLAARFEIARTAKG